MKRRQQSVPVPSSKRLAGHSIIRREKSIKYKESKLHLNQHGKRFPWYKEKLNDTVGSFSFEAFKETAKMLCSLFVRQVTWLISDNSSGLASLLCQFIKVHSRIHWPNPSMWWWVAREMKGIYSGSLSYLEKEINTDLVVAELSYFFL